MKRIILLLIPAIFAAIIVTLLFSPSAAKEKPKHRPTPTPPPAYNPYPPGILPDDLDSEIKRVRDEVNFIENEAPLTIVAPPFAEYVSGHSIFSAAGAEVLKLFTGSDEFGNSVTFAPGTSVVEPGLTPRKAVTLSWSTFKAAANQAGLSRRYGGIHFMDADLNGRAYGHEIGAEDWAVAKTYFNGTVTPAP